MAEGSALATARLAVACAFVAQLPFEIRFPLVTAGPIGVTNLELTAYALVLLWLASLLRGEVAVPRPSRVAIALGVLLLGGLAVSSVLAVYDAGLSVKVSLRLAGAALVGAALAAEWSRAPSRPWLVGIGLTAAVASAILGIVEYVDGWANLGSFFALFRAAPVSVGGFAVRATGPLLHPNLAAWYWGLCAVLSIVLAARSSGLVRVLAVGSAVVLLVATTLALSRGALIATEVAAVTAVAVVPDLRRNRALAVLALVGLPAVVLGTALIDPVVGARLRAETVAEWYRVTISAPEHVRVDGKAGVVPVRIRNDGPLTWHAGEVAGPRLAYHLYDEAGELVTYDGVRTPLPADLPPGGTLQVDARLAAPASAGTYRVEWDMVLEGAGWFEELSGASAPLTATRAEFAVGAPDAAPGTAGPADGPREKDIARSRALTRGDLWGIAAGYVAERPLLGIGPDNFRLGYGGRIGLSAWDQDFNATNLYLEVLTGVGLITGLVFLAWIVVAAAGSAWAGLRHGERFVVIAAIALASLLAHGMFDSFLTFSTAMYVLFAALFVSTARS